MSCSELSAHRNNHFYWELPRIFETEENMNRRKFSGGKGRIVDTGNFEVEGEGDEVGQIME